MMKEQSRSEICIKDEPIETIHVEVVHSKDFENSSVYQEPEVDICEPEFILEGEIPQKSVDWRREDVTKLIEHLKEHPVLWNSKHPQYKYKNARNDALASIKTHMNEFGINCSLEAIKKKIQILRGQYRRENNAKRASVKRTSIGGEAYVPRLWCYSLLEFFPDDDTTINSDPSFVEFDIQDLCPSTSCPSSSLQNTCNAQPQTTPGMMSSNNINTSAVPVRHSTSPSAVAGSGSSSSLNNIENNVGSPMRASPECNNDQGNLKSLKKRRREEYNREAIYNAALYRLSKPPQQEDRFKLYGKNLGLELKEIYEKNPTQALIARTLIETILYKAHHNELSQKSQIVNVEYSSDWNRGH